MVSDNISGQRMDTFTEIYGFNGSSQRNGGAAQILGGQHVLNETNSVKILYL